MTNSNQQNLQNLAFQQQQQLGPALQLAQQNQRNRPQQFAMGSSQFQSNLSLAAQPGSIPAQGLQFTAVQGQQGQQQSTAQKQFQFMGQQNQQAQNPNQAMNNQFLNFNHQRQSSNQMQSPNLMNGNFIQQNNQQIQQNFNQQQNVPQMANPNQMQNIISNQQQNAILAQHQQNQQNLQHSQQNQQNTNIPQNPNLPMNYQSLNQFQFQNQAQFQNQIKNIPNQPLTGNHRIKLNLNQQSAGQSNINQQPNINLQQNINHQQNINQQPNVNQQPNMNQQQSFNQMRPQNQAQMQQYHNIQLPNTANAAELSRLYAQQLHQQQQQQLITGGANPMAGIGQVARPTIGSNMLNGGQGSPVQMGLANNQGSPVNGAMLRAQQMQQKFQQRPLSSSGGSQQGTPRLHTNGQPFNQVNIQNSKIYIRNSNSSNPTTLYANCPQQSTKVFGKDPLHGLVDPTSVYNSVNNSSFLKEVPPSWIAPQQDNVHMPGDGAGISQAGKKRLHSLLDGLDPDLVIDFETEQCLLKIADNFINQVAYRASKLAKHSHSPCIRISDISLELERNWNCLIPGYEYGAKSNSKFRAPLAAHLTRQQSVAKAKSKLEHEKHSKASHIYTQARDMLSQAEMMISEDVKVDDEFTVPTEVIISEKNNSEASKNISVSESDGEEEDETSTFQATPPITNK